MAGEEKSCDEMSKRLIVFYSARVRRARVRRARVRRARVRICDLVSMGVKQTK